MREEKKRQQEIENKRKLQLKAARDEEKKWKEAEREEAKKKRAEEKAWHVSSQTRKRNYDKGSSKEPIAGPTTRELAELYVADMMVHVERLQD